MQAVGTHSPGRKKGRDGRSERGVKHPARPSGAKIRRGRMCVGCGQRVPLERATEELIRLVLVPEPPGLRVVVDLAKRSVGRGAWVHGRHECLARAVARGLSKVAKAKVVTDLAELEQAIETAAERRLGGLMNSAARRKQLAVGTSAVRSSWAKRRIKLLLVARDAAAAAKLSEVRAAVQAGIAVPWGTKQSLAAFVPAGPTQVGVVGVMSDSIALAIRRAIELAETFTCRTTGACQRHTPGHHEGDVSEHPLSN